MPAALLAHVGRGGCDHDEIEIGHQSGESNVRWWLRHHGIAEDDRIVKAVFELAKSTNRMLSEAEILGAVKAIATA